MKPTLGRIVLFHPTPGIDRAAIVAYVHSNTMVNLTVFDNNGESYSQTSVQLVAPGAPKPEFGMFCEWPDYQEESQKIDISTLKVSQETIDALQRIIRTVDMKIQALADAP